MNARDIRYYFFALKVNSIYVFVYVCAYIYVAYCMYTHLSHTLLLYIYLYMKVTTVNKKKQELMKFKLYIHFILLSFWMADDASDLSTVSRNQNS